MYVIQMVIKVILITNHVIPETILPNPSGPELVAKQTRVADFECVDHLRNRKLIDIKDCVKVIR